MTGANPSAEPMGDHEIREAHEAHLRQQITARVKASGIDKAIDFQRRRTAIYQRYNGNPHTMADAILRLEDEIAQLKRHNDMAIHI